MHAELVSPTHSAHYSVVTPLTPKKLTLPVHVCAVAAAPQVVLQLTPRPDVVAPGLAVPARTGDITPRTVILQVHLQTASRHGLVAVAIIGTHHGQLVQDLPDQDATGLDLPLPDDLLFHWTRLLHPQATLEADEAEGVPAGGVHGVHQRLQAYATQELHVRVVGVVVEVVLARLVPLSATVAHDDVPHAPDLEAVGLLQAARPPWTWTLSLRFHVYYNFRLRLCLRLLTRLSCDRVNVKYLSNFTTCTAFL